MMPTKSILEDSAEALGSSKGQSAVLFGDIGVLSLTGTKYTSGGGAILTPRELR
jgi:dTDP-4-amino-4,6-dideoxygalactose transaminase